MGNAHRKHIHDISPNSTDDCEAATALGRFRAEPTRLQCTAASRSPKAVVVGVDAVLAQNVTRVVQADIDIMAGRSAAHRTSTADRRAILVGPRRDWWLRLQMDSRIIRMELLP